MFFLARRVEEAWLGAGGDLAGELQGGFIHEADFATGIEWLRTNVR